MQLKVSKYAETNTHQCKYQRLRILTLSESTETRSHRATTSRSEACNPNTETDPPRLTHFLISYGSLNRKAYLSLSLPSPLSVSTKSRFPKFDKLSTKTTSRCEALLQPSSWFRFADSTRARLRILTDLRNRYVDCNFVFGEIFSSERLRS